MAERTRGQNSPPWFWIGLFFGALIGTFVAFWVLSDQDAESLEEELTRRLLLKLAEEGRLRDGSGRKPFGGSGHPSGHGGHGGTTEDDRRRIISDAKAPLMINFVAALTKKPRNRSPNPDWVSPLKNPESPIDCADCHDPKRFNIDAMRAANPGPEWMARARASKPFMVDVMEKWVRRLNDVHKDKLKERVTCTTCHASDPRGAGENRQTRGMAYAKLMKNFLAALSESPRAMKEPAKRWKPLLKAPGSDAVLCSTCHTDPNIKMDGFMHMEVAETPLYSRKRQDKGFMVELMETWVEKLNRNARDQLRKAVTCLDCHETDPRR